MIQKRVFLKRGEGVARFGRIDYPVLKAARNGDEKESNKFSSGSTYLADANNTNYPVSGSGTILRGLDAGNASGSGSHEAPSSFEEDNSYLAEETSSILQRMELERRDQLSLLEQQTFEGMEQLITDNSLASDSSLIRQFLNLGTKKPVHPDGERPCSSTPPGDLTESSGDCSSESVQNLGRQLSGLVDARFPPVVANPSKSHHNIGMLPRGHHQYLSPSPGQFRQDYLSTVTEEPSQLDESSSIQDSRTSPHLSPVLGNLETRVKQIIDGMGRRMVFEPTPPGIRKPFSGLANVGSSPRVVELSDEEGEHCLGEKENCPPEDYQGFNSRPDRWDRETLGLGFGRNWSYADSAKSSPFVPTETPPVIHLLRRKFGVPTNVSSPTKIAGLTKERIEQRDSRVQQNTLKDPLIPTLGKPCDCADKVSPQQLEDNMASKKSHKPNPVDAEMVDLTCELSEIIARLKEDQIFVDEMREKFETLNRGSQAEKAELEQARHYFEEWKKKETGRMKEDSIRLLQAEKAAQRVINRENEENKVLKKRLEEIEHEKCETEARWCEERSSRKEEKAKLRKEMESLRLELERMKRKSETHERENIKLTTEVQRLRVRLRNSASLTPAFRASSDDLVKNGASDPRGRDGFGGLRKSASAGRLTTGFNRPNNLESGPDSTQRRSRSESRTNFKSNKSSNLSKFSEPDESDENPDDDFERVFPQTPNSSHSSPLATSSSRKQVRFSLNDSNVGLGPHGVSGMDKPGSIHRLFAGTDLVSRGGKSDESLRNDCTADISGNSCSSDDGNLADVGGKDETFVKLPYSPNNSEDIFIAGRFPNSVRQHGGPRLTYDGTEEPTADQQELFHGVSHQTFVPPNNSYPQHIPPYVYFPSPFGQTVPNYGPGGVGSYFNHPMTPNVCLMVPPPGLADNKLITSSSSTSQFQVTPTADASVETSGSLIVDLSVPQLRKESLPPGPGGVGPGSGGNNFEIGSSNSDPLTDDVCVDEVFLEDQDNWRNMQPTNHADFGGKRDDGNTIEPNKVLEKNFGDGSSEIHYDNGTIEKIRAAPSEGSPEDWVTRLSYANGDVMEILADGSKCYSFQSSGVNEVICTNGDKKLISSSGRKKTLLSNGTKEWTLADGTRIQRQHDGTVVRLKPDGTKYVKNKLFKSVTRPDGWTWTQNEVDGRQQFLDPSGTVVRTSSIPKKA